MNDKTRKTLWTSAVSEFRTAVAGAQYLRAVRGLAFEPGYPVEPQTLNWDQRQWCDGYDGFLYPAGFLNNKNVKFREANVVVSSVDGAVLIATIHPWGRRSIAFSEEESAKLFTDGLEAAVARLAEEAPELRDLQPADKWSVEADKLQIPCGLSQTVTLDPRWVIWAILAPPDSGAANR